ncbi:rhodanese-like domain-containing protein [Rhodoferax sp.]|uniref:rhodanese-like domain-containing protein n=1 Tax=Rhodoferax sp. TaxID=50421 RepID=UPI002638A661|nr:rhodanese-like domain-containing protein [Rhodoferax sp.]MDD5480658.1 rhodanese-like domain-containing protein [Rhodoferax sp.]
MKFILDNWMLILVALSAGGMLLWPMLNGAGPGALTADGAVQLMNREKAVVIDICEPAEYAQAHVVGAKNIPMGQLADKLPGAVKNKALPVILVCRSGARSSRALGIAKKLGYENVQSLSGGLGAWRSANLPIEKA